MYIREAHPTGQKTFRGSRVRPRRAFGNGAVSQPRNEEQRHAVARLCVDSLGLTMTTLVDDLDDRVSREYSAWPDRLFVIDTKGRVAYASGPGPWGFEPDEVESVLSDRFGPLVSDGNPDDVGSEIDERSSVGRSRGPMGLHPDAKHLLHPRER